MSWPDNSGTGSSALRTLSRSGIAMCIPSSGTMGANGAVTLTTAFARPYTEGIYLYFPAGAVFAASPAGLYWTVMTNNSVGTVYNNVHTSGEVSIPASPTPIVDAGPGAYVQSTAEIPLRQLVVPGNAMGVNGSIRFTYHWYYNATAGNKTIKATLGGQTMYLRARANVNTDAFMVHFINNGRQDRQVEMTAANQGATYIGGASGGITYLTVNTAVDQNFVVSMQLATATDYTILTANYLEVQF